MKARRLLAGVAAAAMMSGISAIGAWAGNPEYVTVTFDPNGKKAFQPIKVQIEKGSTLFNEVNGFDSHLVFYDSNGNIFVDGDYVIDDYFFDTEGENWCDFNEHIFNEDTTLYAQWTKEVREIRVVYSPSVVNIPVSVFLRQGFRVSDKALYHINSEYSYVIDLEKDKQMAGNDVFEEGKRYRAVIDIDTNEEDVVFANYSRMKAYINGRDVTDEMTGPDTVVFEFTPEYWVWSNVDMKEPQKGVTIKDVMTLIQLANGNKKPASDGQYVAADINEDTVVNYKDVMLAIREFKNPGSLRS